MNDGPARGAFIDDESRLVCPEVLDPLYVRIRELSVPECTTEWMLVETAAIATLLMDGGITASQVWQLTLPHYNIDPSVESVPDPRDDPGWLAQPLADRSLVWSHLTALQDGQALKPVPALPGPYDEETPEGEACVHAALGFHSRRLELIWDRFGSGLSVEEFLSNVGFRLRYDIESLLAARWMGGPFAVGASLHALPLPGGGFGTGDQPVYVLKALVAALDNDIRAYDEAERTGRSSEVISELRGGVLLWGMLIKGYVYDMVRTRQVRIVADDLLGRRVFVLTLKSSLMRAKEISDSGEPIIPEWGGGRRDCELQREIAGMDMSLLLQQLDERLSELQRGRPTAPLVRHAPIGRLG